MAPIPHDDEMPTHPSAGDRVAYTHANHSYTGFIAYVITTDGVGTVYVIDRDGETGLPDKVHRIAITHLAPPF